MTDEERKKLCNALRSSNWFCGPEAKIAEQAADEIERLAALAQSNAEPVAWRWRFKRDDWSDWALTDKRPATDYENAPPYEVHALYTAPTTQSNAEPPKEIYDKVKGHAVTQSDAEPVRAFAKAVLHGDNEHKAWLMEAAEAFIAGRPLPAPRGKGVMQSNAEPVIQTEFELEDGLHELAFPVPPRSDTEPVEWQYRCRTNELSTWSEWRNCNQELADQLILKKSPFYQMRRSPPRHDASVELIKAANELSYAATCLEDAKWPNAAEHCRRAEAEARTAVLRSLK